MIFKRKKHNFDFEEVLQDFQFSKFSTKKTYEHKIVNSETLIWKQGLLNWVPFSEINSVINEKPISNQSYTNSGTVNSTDQNIESHSVLNALNLDSYYQSEFEQIIHSKEFYKGKWNWWAFLFGPIWCFSKGLWQYALIFLIPYLLVYLFVSVDLAVVCALIWAIVLGMKGTWFYYNLKVKNKQI